MQIRCRFLPISHAKLCSSDIEKIIFQRKPYCEAEDALLFLASRPIISYTVGVINRYLNTCNMSHWNVVKRIFKYLKEIWDYDIMYMSDTSDLTLERYCIIIIL